MEYLPVECKRYAKYLYDFDYDIMKYYKSSFIYGIRHAPYRPCAWVVKYPIDYELMPGWSNIDDNYIIITAAEHGYLDLIKYMYSCGKQCALATNAMDGAIRGNHLNVVKYLYEVDRVSSATHIGTYTGKKYSQETFNNTCDPEMIKYLMEIKSAQSKWY